MKTLLLPLLVGLPLASQPAVAQPAQAAVELTGGVMLERTSETDGVAKVELVTPEVVVPGDRLVFTTTYRNATAAAVENFAVTNALPAPVMLADDVPADLQVSIDGGQTWDLLASLSVVEQDGSKRAAQAADVTHVRWTINSIAPGVSGEVRYRAVVR